jgi:hypothetical protein
MCGLFRLTVPPNSLNANHAPNQPITILSNNTGI